MAGRGASAGCVAACGETGELGSKIKEKIKTKVGTLSCHELDRTSERQDLTDQFQEQHCVPSTTCCSGAIHGGTPLVDVIRLELYLI